MLDVKNTIMLFAYFRKRFVILLMAITAAVIYLLILIYQFFIL
ncbi:hypothetical protein [Metabacillus sp. RGM 3146]